MSDVVQKIIMDLIDEPATAMRSQTDTVALQDLADSIASNGLIQPIILKKTKGRFEIVAGHRRYQAHRLNKATHIEAIVKIYTDEQAESAKVHENLFREDVNAVDQAVFLSKYVARTKADLATLARMLHRSEEWVKSRLDILTYPDYLIDEVYSGKISLGVAAWLAQIPSEAVKAEYTRFAALQGINIKTAKRWYEMADAGILPEKPSVETEIINSAGQPQVVPMVRCFLCQNMDELGNLQTDFVHYFCRKEFAEEMYKKRDEVQASPPEATV